MAVELATAFVNIVPSARGIGRNLGRELGSPIQSAARQAGDDAGRTITKGVQTRLGGASRAIAKTAGLAFAGVGLGLGALGAFGVKAAGQFEQTRIAFEGILGSAGEADQFLGQLRSFAAKTPFEFPELADSAKNLLAVGFAADDVLPTMTRLGNVAATLGVGGAEIQGVVRALGQMKGKGKASAEELQQISEQLPGFSAINAIAEDMGVTTAEAFAQMAKGAIPADQAINAILVGMEKFPGAAGAMERQSLTLLGVLSTFKDTIRDSLVDALEPVLPTLSKALTDVTPLLQSSLSGIVQSIAPLIPVFLKLVTEALSAVGPIVSSLTETLAPILGQVGTLLAETFVQLQPVFKELQPVLAELGAAFVELLRAVLPLVPPLAELALVLVREVGVPTIVAIARAIELLATALTPLLENTTLLTPVVTALGFAFVGLKAVKGLRAGLLGLAKGAGTAYGTMQRLLASTVAQRVASIATAAASKVLAAAQIILNAVMAANPVVLLVAAIAALAVGIFLAYQKFKPFRDIVDAVGRALAAAARVIVTAAMAAFNWIKDHWPLILTILTGPVGIAVRIIIAHWNKILGAAKLIFGAIAKTVGLYITIVRTVITTAWQVLTTATSVAWGIIKSAVLTPFNAIRDGLTTAIGVIKLVWEGFWGGLHTVVKSAVGLIKAPINAILSAIQAVYDGFKTLWNAIQIEVPSFDPPGPGPTFGGFTLGLPDLPDLNIPRLGKGALVSEATLALVGEVPNQREIVSPEPLLRSIVRDELDAGKERKLADSITFHNVKPDDVVRRLSWAQKTGVVG